jgi:hypothetical protein
VDAALQHNLCLGECLGTTPADPAAEIFILETLMPLSEPTSRQAIHDRHVHCAGFRREDGLWDIEGHLTDTKTYAFENRERGAIEAGTPIHEMWMRLTIDDELNIHAVETHTDHAPYSICPDILPNFQSLIGLQIGRGFRRGVAQRLGGVHGCTHLVELLGPMATTAFQTMAGQRHATADTERAPMFLNTCHAHASDSVVVKLNYPKFYTGT